MDEEQAALALAAELRVRVGRERETVKALRDHLQARAEVQAGSEVTGPEPTGPASAGGVPDADVVDLAAPSGTPLVLTVRRGDDGAYAVVITGEVDVDVAPWLRQHLVDLVDAGATELALDLAGVPFMDSAGLGALLHVRRWALASGASLRVTAVSPGLLRLLRVTGLQDVLLDGAAC